MVSTSGRWFLIMSKYIPFLKLKQNEIMALKELEAGVLDDITPFFDFAKREDLTEQSFIDSAVKLEKALSKHIGDIQEIYLDNYDIESNFQILGSNNYLYLLGIYNSFTVTPVISIDRSNEHNQSASIAKDSGIVSSNTVAIRLTEEDFQDFSLIEDDIKDELADIINKFESVDLILDCRVCKNSVADDLSNKISSFISAFCNEYVTRRIIVTGSSIPASISEVTRVETNTDLARVELEIYKLTVIKCGAEQTLTLGDYATVSPNYSDINLPGNIMQNITAPKIIYSYNDNHHIIRGGALKTHRLGLGQYEVLTQQLLNEPFYRGETYSGGDKYLAQKSRAEGNNATPTTMVKPLINAHISYMCKDYI
jgi:hypothetical protein